jgi:hypothetical protein
LHRTEGAQVWNVSWLKARPGLGRCATAEAHVNFAA